MVFMYHSAVRPFAIVAGTVKYENCIISNLRGSFSLNLFGTIHFCYFQDLKVDICKIRFTVIILILENYLKFKLLSGTCQHQISEKV